MICLFKYKQTSIYVMKHEVLIKFHNNNSETNQTLTITPSGTLTDCSFYYLTYFGLNYAVVIQHHILKYKDAVNVVPAV